MSDRPTATTNRCTVLKTAGTVGLAGLASSGSAIAQTDLPVEIEQNAEEEYVLLRNIGDDSTDDGDDGDGDDGSDGDDEDMVEKSGDDKDVTDADGDGVAATDDADDDCPKGN